MTNWKSFPLTLGHSPDPDDAFMFYAMAEGKIDLRGYRFEHILQDIQTLNERALRGELHISAVSIHACAFITNQYALLSSGASMGDGYGPMFVTSEDANLPNLSDWEMCRKWLSSKRIAIPGRMTTAYLVARIFLGDFDYLITPFDAIFSAVSSGEADVGLIIHEGQLTYQKEGFTKVLDLGEWWKARTQLPLPLGGNVIRKDISPSARKDISEILKESIQYGLKYRKPAVAHSMAHARGMDAFLADKFIGMYVNAYTLDYGKVGRQAVQRLLSEAHENGLIPSATCVSFQ
ncbi:MAG: ABC transporter substrate-binding protein [Verrucomicrobia bacterium]|nr:MAG: ABC transporter substrate-binding protein [Verrucomicrobiota bacterium]